MWKLAVFVCMLALLSPKPLSADDARTVINLPPEIRAQFLTEMRAHMATLDDIVAELSDGDFKEAANIADIKLDFGHRMWERMAAKGIPPAQIVEMKQYLQNSGIGVGQRSGRGQGVGRYMPEDFRAMGQSFHQSGAEFAQILRTADEPPTAEDFQNALTALSDVTAACRSCHDVFQVE